jgi:putative protease
VSYEPDFSLVPARSRPLSREQLEAQLRKSGDTPFVIRECPIAYDGTLFAPVGELNRLRREFLARAGEALAASFLPSPDEVARSRRRVAALFPEPPLPAPESGTGTAPGPLALTVYADSREAVSMALEAGCTGICYEPAVLLPGHTCRAGAGDARSFPEQAADAMALCRDAGARFVLKLPRITRDGYLGAVLPAIALLHQEGLGECLVENPGAAHAIRTLVPGMGLSGAAGMNIFNHRAACHLAPPFRSFTLSPELSGSECGELVRAARDHGCTASFALIVQGISEAMVTEDCIPEPVRHCRAPKTTGPANPFLGIRDATGHIFPVRTDGECRTRIGNAVETCLVDHLPAIRKAGIAEIVVDARGRSGAYAGAMTQIYREATVRVNAGTSTKEASGLLKDRAKAIAYGGITAGHFLRGLKE